MGLDTSHNCWHGPYSSFTRFRNKLAELAGYEVKNVTYDDGFTSPTASIDWPRIERENPHCFQGDWRTIESDPLVYLIAHSDCDGVLHPAQARALANRLAELLPLIQDDRGCERMKAKTEQFIAGLRDAVGKGEDVDFH